MFALGIIPLPPAGDWRIADIRGRHCEDAQAAWRGRAEQEENTRQTFSTPQNAFHKSKQPNHIFKSSKQDAILSQR